ncbi:hypothetical protein PR048_031872 [Dryococelus australis]|uniref:Uncharacterized protein n=1 Tax=Dryococelus australis TaxID=614101 RepID=A0ABQ9G9F1_9NEOP|nr:hypothetical protein PR048_031872 [Dryococelus australis]
MEQVAQPKARWIKKEPVAEPEVGWTEMKSVVESEARANRDGISFSAKNQVGRAGTSCYVRMRADCMFTSLVHQESDTAVPAFLGPTLAPCHMCVTERGNEEIKCSVTTTWRVRCWKCPPNDPEAHYTQLPRAKRRGTLRVHRHGVDGSAGEDICTSWLILEGQWHIREGQCSVTTTWRVRCWKCPPNDPEAHYTQLPRAKRRGMLGVHRHGVDGSAGEDICTSRLILEGQWHIREGQCSVAGAGLKTPVYLELFSTFEADRRGSDKGDTATRIKSPIAAKLKALNWRAVFSSCCMYLWDFQRQPYYLYEVSVYKPSLCVGERGSRRAGHALACDGLEEPERDPRLVIGGEVNLAGEAAQMLQWLRAHVVEVDDVAHSVEQREEEGGASGDLVELYVGVQRYVLLDRELLQLGEQQQAVAEGERGGRASRDRYAHAHDVPQVRVLRHEGVEPADLLCTRCTLVHHRYGAREALGSNPGVGKARYPRENPSINGIVRHDIHMRKTGVTRPGIEPGSHWWEASRLTAQPPWPLRPSSGSVELTYESFDEEGDGDDVEYEEVEYVLSILLQECCDGVPLPGEPAASRLLWRADLHHRGSKLDPRSDRRSIQKTVAPLEFRAWLKIEMDFISIRRIRRFKISIRDQRRIQPIAKFASNLISSSHFGTKINESEHQNRAISLVQHFYNGTKIKLNPGSELGSLDLGSGGHTTRYKKTPVFPNTFIHFPRKNVGLEDANRTTAYPAEGTRQIRHLPGDVGRHVEEVLLGALAVEAYGHKVALVVLHHDLEVGVGQGRLVLEAGVVEHTVYQLGHVVVGETGGACDLHQRAQHLRQLSFVDAAVAVVVAHVEDDAQLVLSATAREQHHRVQELLRDVDKLHTYNRFTNTNICRS